MSKLFLSALSIIISSTLYGQGFPWERPLKMAWSNDGITFNTPSIFQDSSGVPSVIRWKGDTLICAFQWFRVPTGSASWDKVAVKFSYDKGMTWTAPTPIVISGMPAGYQRAFDPTLCTFGNDSIRIYYSSSAQVPIGGLDSTVNTYSAKSADGINYVFEPNPRVDVANNRVIDPAVIYFKTGWHYTSPIGSPQQGAYHYVSPNGINFTAVPAIVSDNMHNWTGNLMIKDTNELRFYGSSPSYIWYNHSSNGGVWNGYVNTNILGGDPSTVQLAANNFLMIYVGQPYVTSEISNQAMESSVKIFPNPSSGKTNIQLHNGKAGLPFWIIDQFGKTILTGKTENNYTPIDIQNLPSGIYLMYLGDTTRQVLRVVIE